MKTFKEKEANEERPKARRKTQSVPPDIPGGTLCV